MFFENKLKLKSNSWHLIVIFLFVFNSFYAFYVSGIYFAIYLLFALYFWISKPPLKLLLFAIMLTIILFLIYYLFDQWSLFDYLSDFFDNLFHYSLRNEAIKFVNHNYNERTASFINLVIFNYKDDVSSSLYQSMINLSIIFMIVIGGFHLSILKNIISKCFKKCPKILVVFINCFLITFYCYFLSFSVACLRVLLTYIFWNVIKKTTNDYFDALSLSGIVTMLLGPKVIFKYGFDMSYLCTIGIIWVNKLHFKGYFTNKLLTNLVAIILSLPFVISMNQRISLFAFINSFLFSYLFSYVFVYFLFTFWIVWIWPIQNFIVNFVWNSVNFFDLINIYINLNFKSHWFNMFYYYFCFLSMILFNHANHHWIRFKPHSRPN